MGTGVTGTPGALLLVLPLLGLLCHGTTAASSDPAEHRLPGAMVVGTVYCDTCFHGQFSKTSHFISGAVVAVECGGEDAPAAKQGFRREARTNGRGVFVVHLPPSVGKHLKSIQACSVRLVSSGEPFCSVAASATSSALRLSRSRKKSGAHVFSAGFFTFKPLQQPELCYQKPSPAAESPPQLRSSKTFGPFPQLPQPAFPLFPPLPNLPRWPNLPSFPPPAQPKSDVPPSSTAPAAMADQKQDRSAFFQPPPIPSFGGLPSPSRPFQPPPSLVQPPNTFQQPPPSLLPNSPPFFQPPPQPSFSLPLPNPTPPSSPLPGFPFPQFPFPSFPFFPGVPPAVPSTGGSAGAAPPP